MMTPQVERSHYNFLSYVHIQRWCSYYHQISEIIRVSPNRILMIGKGDDIVSDVVKSVLSDTTITTVDFDSALMPDICADVRKLSEALNGEKYDCIVCCQVLEHLQYNDFPLALNEIKQCMTEEGTLILSLPDSGLPLGIRINTPHIKSEKTIKICHWWYKDFEFNGEHYWEINSAKPYSVKKIRRVVAGLFEIKKEFLANNNDFHRFFILKNRDINE